MTDRPARRARQEGEAHPGAGRRSRSRRSSAASTGTTTYEGFGDVDFVIEAVPEQMEIKQAVFAELDAVTPGHAILASNTSSLSITEIGEATLRPEKVVGFHYFYPASVMPLIEIIEGDDTSQETLQAGGQVRPGDQEAADHAAPRCPGFVVNRILNSGIGEVWRDAGGAGPVDQEDRRGHRRRERRADGAVLPHQPARPGHRLPRRRAPARVLRRPLLRPQGHGQPRRSRASSAPRPAATASTTTEGNANLEGDGDPDVDELVELLTLKTFVEACLVLEEGVATHRDIDFGMMAGAGLDPRRGLLPPFMKADVEGLDTILERLESAAGEARRALRAADDPAAPGRPGPPGHEERPGLLRLPAGRRRAAGARSVVKLETRGDVAIAWLANGQMNSIAPPVISDLGAVWDARRGATRRPRARDRLVEPVPVQRGRRHQGVHADGRGRRRAAAHEAHALLREMETGRRRRRSPRSTAWRSAAAASWRWPATCGSPRESAIFGQPEIKLGIIPGFGGTQRLPRLVGENKALEMNLIGDPIGAEEAFEFGLVNRVVPDHELLDTALAWARKLAEQAPLAVEQIKQVSRQGRPRRGHRGREGRLRARCSSPRTARRASAPSSASASRSGRASSADGLAARDAGGADPRGRLGRRAHRRGDLGAVGDPRLPLARHRAVGERQPDGGRAHRRVARRPRALLALLRQPLPDAARTRSPTARTARWSSSSAAGVLDARHHAEHRHAAPQGRARASSIEVHGTIEHSSCLACGAQYPLDEVARAACATTPLGVPRCDCGAAAEARRRAVRRVPARGRAGARLRARRRRRRAALRRLVAGGPPDRPAARRRRAPAAARSRSSRRARRRGTAGAAVKLDGDVVAELEALVAAL